MKKDKKWLLRKFRELTFEFQDGYLKVKAIDVVPLIEQLDNPEKIVIPQFVADWWEHDDDSVTMYEGVRIEKKHKLDLVSYFQDRGLIDSLSKVEVWIDENESIFLDLVNGKPYEVEEHKYYVLLGNQSHDDNWTYALTNSGSIEVFEKDVLPEWDRTKLTEKEIKDYDERFWQFAVEVAE